MSNTNRKESILNWLESEKNKDKIEVERTKQKYIQQIKGLTKEDLFPPQKKLTLWQKIKILLSGN